VLDTAPSSPAPKSHAGALVATVIPSAALNSGLLDGLGVQFRVAITFETADDQRPIYVGCTSLPGPCGLSRPALRPREISLRINRGYANSGDRS